MSRPRTAVVWFRRDLRTHDHEPLVEAAAADRLLPVYVFDPERYGTREFGGDDSFAYEKTGGFRTRFRLEAVADLRSRLRAAGSDLLVRVGPAPATVADLADDVDADAVYAHTRPTPEERAVETALAERLADAGVAFERYWGHTLYRPEDLPSSVEEIDDTYTPFRHAVESEATVREPLDRPAVPARPAVEPGEIPTAEALGVEPATDDDRAALAFEGGETAGLDRLETYLWTTDSLREYKQTRNGLVGRDYSSKLSAWLNEGCLSPRRVHEAVERYEAERVANDSTYWLVFELLWRDFFQFQFAKHGAQFFAREGIRRREIDWREDPAALARWKRGETGIPFVDAAMRELTETGYLSNRGRQIAASFLANDLRIDWRRGAAYFETRLVDYDPASNYGNWAYVAGVGNDSRNRKFDVLGQAHYYDPEAAYVKRWVPAVEPLEPADAHAPWRLSAERRRELGVEYPDPVLELPPADETDE
ncbi:DASH family cryptochrome [Halorussus marinus]|uniref:DASH family cryptochrome n=1 Tax=Halorussus marinus TaxID=2505976 RepID=UPI001091EE82|nr:DASH family cryptochrome [Halorussus marinus]